MSVLEGILVLDLTRARAGPTAARQLGDWGADVIRIELPASVEEEDTLGGARHGPDFQNIQRGRRSLSLNLKTEEGRDILKALVARADVLVENYRPDVKRRLGIDYDTMKAVNPRLIYASISGFGQDGPYAMRPGFDQIAQGMAGLMTVTGEPGRGPMRAGIAVADMSAGLFCSIGILLALLERGRSGEGQWVSSTLLESLIFMMDFQAARWLVAGEVPGQAGNDHPTFAPMGVFKSKDGVMNIAPGGEPIWKRFCKVIGAPEMIDDPDYASGAMRARHREKLNAEINARLGDRTTAEWVELFNDNGIPSGPIYTIDEVFADPQVQHLGIATPLVHPKLGEIKVVGQPVRMSRTPSKLSRSAPDKGEHTDEILAELGFSQDQIDDWRKRQVV